MYDAWIILATDLYWTAMSAAGIYFALDERRAAKEDEPYYQRTGRRAFGRLMRLMANFHAAAVLFATALGILVVSTDIYTWISHTDVLEIDARRIFHRLILEAVLTCVVGAMAVQKRIRDM